MAQMAVGVSEMYARDLFTRYKYDLANTLLDFQWNAASEVEKNQFSDMREALKSFDIYTLTGVPFNPNTRWFLNSLKPMLCAYVSVDCYSRKTGYKAIARSVAISLQNSPDSHTTMRSTARLSLSNVRPSRNCLLFASQF
jgi:hypothetical protein